MWLCVFRSFIQKLFVHIYMHIKWSFFFQKSKHDFTFGYVRDCACVTEERRMKNWEWWMHLNSITMISRSGFKLVQNKWIRARDVTNYLTTWRWWYQSARNWWQRQWWQVSGWPSSLSSAACLVGSIIGRLITHYRLMGCISAWLQATSLR